MVDGNEAALAAALAACAVSVARLCAGLSVHFGERRADKRLQGVAERQGAARRRPAQAIWPPTARKQVADTLKELEEPAEEAREGVAAPAPGARGTRMSRRKVYWIASVVCGVVLALIVTFALPPSGTRQLLAVVIGRRRCCSACRAGSSAKLTKRRQSKFIDEFANAIDVIVRGVKSGLPLNECLRIIARESAEPIAERVHRARRAAARRRAAGRSASSA